MTQLPKILDGLPVHWAGVDDTTPDGCSLTVTTLLGKPTTYVIRNGQVIGRIESDDLSLIGYAGGGLKGGSLIGWGDFAALAAKIADYPRAA